LGEGVCDVSRSSRDKPADSAVQQVLDTLTAYDNRHAKESIEAYRQNSASIRVRILDPDFHGLDRAEREDLIWAILDQLPDGIRSQITQLLLLTPGEASSSFANFEFENPIPSNL
jgi:hypothetical protein